MQHGTARQAVRTAVAAAVWALTLLAALTVTVTHPAVVLVLATASAWFVRSELVSREACRPRPFEELAMQPTLPTAVLVVVALVVTAIGAVDAALSGQEDLLAVLAILIGLHLLLLTRLRGGRQQVPLRSDLVTWLRARAAVSGESVEVLADRSIATYRAMYGDAPEGVHEDAR